MNNNINIAQSQPKNLSPSPGFIKGWVKQHAEKLRKSNFEFKDFNDYQNNFSGTPASNKEDWDGSDGTWRTIDREELGERWIKAVRSIIKNKYQDRIKPFKEVLHFYYTVQLINNFYFGHEFRWIKGATHLINTLQTYLAAARIIYKNGLAKMQLIDPVYKWISKGLNLDYVTFVATQSLLAKINLNIVNWAIGHRFYNLFEGVYMYPVLKGWDAYIFDRDFIMYEQRDVAFTVYDNYKGTDALEQVHKFFNNEGLVGLAAKLIVNVPVFPQYFSHPESSNLKKNVKIYGSLPPDWTLEYRDNSNPSSKSKYGQEARIQVPLLMLYPGTKEENFVKNDPLLKEAPLVKKHYDKIVERSYYNLTSVHEKYRETQEAVYEYFNFNYLNYLK